MKLQKDYISTLLADVQLIWDEYRFDLSVEPVSNEWYLLIDKWWSHEEEVFFHRKSWSSVFVYSINRWVLWTHQTGTQVLLANSISYFNHLFNQVWDSFFLYKKDLNNVIIRWGKAVLYWTPYTIPDLDTSVSWKNLISNSINYIYVVDGNFIISSTEIENQILLYTIITDVSGMITSVNRYHIFQAPQKWDTWATWPQWIQGLKWDTWATWPQGIHGIKWDKWDKGDKGDTGPQWPKWDTGDTGLQGPQGIQWPKGLDGQWVWDMLKSVYDANDDWIIDHAALADTAPWSGISGKPTEFNPTAHNHDSLYSPLWHNHDASYYLKSEITTLLSGKQNSLWFTPENSANKWVANGYASLDASWLVPSSQLPSYVDVVHKTGNESIGGIKTFTWAITKFWVDIGNFDWISLGGAKNMDIRIWQESGRNMIFGWKYNATANNAYAIIESYGWLNPLILQTSGGNVWISTPWIPVEKLEVNGNIFASWWHITARNAKFFSWDLNTLTETWPHTANNLTNKPSWSTTWGYVEVIRWSTSDWYILQRWTDMEWAIPWIWVRTKTGSWNPWVQISWPWLDFTPTASVIQSIAWARYKRESKKVFLNIKMTVNVTSGFEFAFSGLPAVSTTNHTVLQVRLRQGFGSTIYWASAEPSGTSSMYVSVHSPLTSFPSWNWDVYISGFYEMA